MTQATFEPYPVMAPENPFEEVNYAAHHTISAKELAEQRGLIKESNPGVQEFSGRPIIDRSTFPLEGKVDIRCWVAGGEAIVVDSVKVPAGYNKLRDAFGQEQRFKPREERSVLESIFSAVSKTMEYDLAHTDRVANQVATARPNTRKVNLGWYLEDGKGVCRHMALAAAWLGGEAYQNGLLNGTLTTEVNQRDQGNKHDAHEWARYTTVDGEVYIIDPAQQFFGTLEDSVAKGAGWEYFLGEDEKKAYIARNAGEFITQSEVTVVSVSESDPKIQQLQTESSAFRSVNQQFMGILRDNDKMAAHGEADIARLKGATERSIIKSTDLFKRSIDVKGTFEALEIAKLYDEMADDIGLEREYARNMIVDSETIKAWIDKVSQAVMTIHGRSSSDNTFSFAKKYNPKISQQLWRSIEKF